MTPSDPNLDLTFSALSSKHIRLTDPDQSFLVSGGGADLFYASMAHARLPMGRVEEGALLYGFAPSLFGADEVIAIADPDSVISPYAPTAGRAASDKRIAGMRQWAEALALAAASYILPHPRADLRLKSDLPFGVERDQVIMPAAESLWCDLGEVNALLFGLEPVTGMIALPIGAWLVIENAGSVQAQVWAQEFAPPNSADHGLRAFNNAMVEIFPLLRGMADADEFNRLNGRQIAHEIDQSQTIARFANIMGNQARFTDHAALDQPLLQVVRRLAARLGRNITRPNRASRSQQDQPYGLEELARASGLSIQPVTLAARWWQYESDAMVVYDQSQSPYAAIWQGSYYLAYPANGPAIKIAAKNAAHFGPTAHQIFASLPAAVDFVALLAAGLRSSRKDLWFYGIATILGGVLGQVLPLATNLIFSVVVPTAQVHQLWPVALMITAIAFCAFLIALSAEVSRQRSLSRLQSATARGIWDRVARFSMMWHRTKSGSQTTLAAQGAINSANASAVFGFTGATAVGLLCSSLWVIGAQSLAAALLVAALVLCHLAVGSVAAWMQLRAFAQGEVLTGTADMLMLQMVDGLTKLRNAGAEDRFLLRWADRYSVLRKRNILARRIANLLEAWIVAFPLFATVLLFLLLYQNQATQTALKLSMADIMSVITAFIAVIMAISTVLRALTQLLMSRPGWKLGQAILVNQPEDLTLKTDPGPLEGRVEISNLSFGFEEQPQLFRGLSVSINPGEMVALVGQSGSGKSTLLRLILGLETPKSGAIYIDGQDLRNLDMTFYRRQIGTVLQHEALPPGTIADGVRATLAASDEAIWRALRQAAIFDEIHALPAQLYTLLTDAKRVISGGQLQRLALARAFIKDPSLLLLDEATSALDGQAQSHVMAHISQMRATRVVVAHRLSTIRNADRILVLHQGQIVEDGSYDDLMTKKGVFSALVGGQVLEQQS